MCSHKTYTLFSVQIPKPILPCDTLSKTNEIISCLPILPKLFRQIYPLQLFITLLTFLINCPISVDPSGLTLYRE